MSFLKHCSRIGLRSSIRSFSAGSDALVDVKTDNKGIATVTMNRPPVNSLNFHHLEALHQTFLSLERDRCRGMILTSSSPTVFSAGLDILEMYQPTIDKARQFWRMLQDTWIKLYSSPYPTVAVINGHSPAGGCLLALSCEYRVIVPKVTIGLNETQLGIVAPQWFQDCLKNVIGVRKAEVALTSGHMFTSDEALNVGLVDEIVNDKEAGLVAAGKFLAVHSKIPVLARTSVKLGFRKDTLSRLVNGREVDTKLFIEFITHPKVQEGLGKYLESLKKK
ncbi:enoyl-CoA delta isomerase 1, mitochondrial-like [Rhodnius prolixus]|uniref:Enoyl-CoA delta isomerase 1, mitochondrial n=2 Tax=Rhodnius TaxID=13248 RepID=R4G430_RHOPR